MRSAKQAVTAAAAAATFAISVLHAGVGAFSPLPAERPANSLRASTSRTTFTRRTRDEQSTTALFASSSNDDGDGEDKFSFAQRIESAKCAVTGAVAGGVCVTPFAAYHDILYLDPLTQNGLAQWEFDTDMGSIEGALFAIVYRYAIRGDDNPMLNQGAVGAFVLVRTLSRIQTPTTCSAIPLSCGEPIGYFNWDMINQGLLSGVESAALFGGAALAMEYAFDKGWIGKFR